MAKATATFYATHPETGRAVEFNEGDDVPDAIAVTLGAHVIDEYPEGFDPDAVDFDLADSGVGGEAFDAAVAVKVDEVVEQRTTVAVEEQRDREQAAYDLYVGAEDPFDPDTASAGDVKAYLEGIDRDTVAGAVEYDRVVDAEKAGKNRSTAFPA